MNELIWIGWPLRIIKLVAYFYFRPEFVVFTLIIWMLLANNNFSIIFWRQFNRWYMITIKIPSDDRLKTRHEIGRYVLVARCTRIQGWLTPRISEMRQWIHMNRLCTHGEWTIHVHVYIFVNVNICPPKMYEHNTLVLFDDVIHVLHYTSKFRPSSKCVQKARPIVI